MQKREGRSFAPPPSRPPQPEPGRTGRKRWMRSDVPRPAAPVQAPLPSPAAIVTDIDEPEEETLDVMGCLSVEARRDVLATSLGGIGGGAFMSGAPTRRGLLTGSAAAALGLAAGVAPALAVGVPKRGDTPSVDAALIELAGRVSRLAGRLTTARARSEQLTECVEGIHPKPSLPVSNDVFHAYQAEIRPTEDRIGLTRLRKVNFRSIERLDRWSSDLAAMASGTAAGLAAKASAVLQFDDLSSDSEAAEMLALSVLHDAVRLGGGAHA